MWLQCSSVYMSPNLTDPRVGERKFSDLTLTGVNRSRHTSSSAGYGTAAETSTGEPTTATTTVTSPAGTETRG